MALDFMAEEGMTSAELVSVQEDLQPYVLEWPSVPDSDGVAEATVLVVDAGPIGASTGCAVDAVLVEGGIRSPTGVQVAVILVDVAEELVSQMRRAEEVEDIAFAFDPDSPYALPDPNRILAFARDWIQAAGEETGLAFYTADGHVEDAATANGEETPETPRPAARASQRRASRAPKPGAAPSGGGPQAEKPKRITTASLAVPALTDQIHDQAADDGDQTGCTLQSGGFGLVTATLFNLGSQSNWSECGSKSSFYAPPRTRDPGPSGSLRPQSFQPQELLNRDLGLILFQLMGVLDFMQTENWGAAKDATALLAVCIDQAVLDEGRFDLAALLTLQEDPPAAIYMNRPQGLLSRSKAFSPLADQRWVTVALAFVKEMDAIQGKRLELSGGQQNQAKGTGGGEPTGKAKAQPKKKGKGRGRGSDQAADAEEESHSSLWNFRRAVQFGSREVRSELGACLHQLEHFFSKCPELRGSYLEGPIGFREDPALFPSEEYPQLAPYRALDASRLRLVGEGNWPMGDFIEGPLWLPYFEPLRSKLFAGVSRGVLQAYEGLGRKEAPRAFRRTSRTRIM
eukprot:s818_g17.t1